jgi:hypothetical protein
VTIRPFQRLFRAAPVPVREVSESEAVRDDADAEFRAGLEHARGVGDSQDFAAAARCYLQAADRSHPSAEFNLGMLYARGQGVPQDEVQALMWIRRAAEQGSPDAQFDLGMRHYRSAIRLRSGNATESRIEAYKWLRLAAAQDHPESETTCFRVVLSMSREEVADGNQRVAAFQVEHPTPSPRAP